MKSNFFLFIKQGIKSIFKYKLQFIIIFTLALLSSILFSAGYTAEQRLYNNYNKIFQNTPKFDYEYKYSVGDTAKHANSKTSFAPYMDIMPEYNSFINNQGIYNLFITPDANWIYKPTSFTTGDKFSDSYYSLLSNYNNKGGLFNRDQFKNNFLNNIAQITIDKGQLQYKAAYQINYNQFTNNVTAHYIDILNTYLTKYIGDSSTNKKWLDNNRTLYTKLLINYYNNLNSKDKKADKVKIINDFLNSDYGNPRAYLQYVINLVPDWVNKTINDFLNNVFTATIAREDFKTAYATAGDDKNKIETAMNTNAAKYLESVIGKNDATKSPFYQLATKGLLYKISGSTSKPISDFKNYYQNIFFTWFTGEDLNIGTPFTNIDLTSLKGVYKTDFNTATPPPTSTVLNSFSDIYIKGFRGMINPTIYNNDSKIYSSYRKFKDLVYSTPFERNLNLNNLSNNYYLMHQYFAGDAAGYNVHFLNQAYYFDSVYKINYRFNIIYSSNYKSFNSHIHIIDGYKPTKFNEIAISPQFAKKNGWKIGSVHTIASYSFVVTAYATDPYSFIPITNYSSPIPKVSTSAVVYVPYSAWYLIKNGNVETIYSKQYTNVFLTDKNTSDSQIIKKQKLDDFYSYLNNSENVANKAVEHFQNIDKKFVMSNNTALGSDTFSGSIFHYNWTMPKSLIKDLQYTYIIASAIMLLLCLTACWITINRNMKKNAKQIGILKSMGVRNSKIALSYVMHSFALIVFVIPLGWLIGLVLQIPVCSLFFSFFSFDNTIFSFNPMPLLILEGVIGVFALIVSLMSAWIILRKNVILIIKEEEKWKPNILLNKIRSKLFNKLSFVTRFKFNIFDSSLKQVSVLTVVILMASALLTVSLALPNLIQNISNSYYKNLNYSNNYIYNDPVFDAPFSKMATNAWGGNSNLNAKYKNNNSYTKKINGKYQQIDGYSSFLSYLKSVESVTPMSLINFNPNNSANKKWEWSYATHLNKKDIINYISSSFGNNLYEGIGSAFSTGDINSILQFYYQSLDNPKSKTSDEKVENLYNKFSKGIPDILGTVIDQKIKDKGKDWIHQINDLLLTQVPPFVSQYVYSTPSRTQQFSFGYNTNLYDYNKDHLSTTSQIKYGNSDITTIGMNSGYKLFNISKKFFDNNKNDSVNNIFTTNADNNNLKTLDSYLESYNMGIEPQDRKDIVLSNGQKIYDAKNNKLIIPIIANKQAGSIFKTNAKSIIINQNIRPEENYLWYIDSNKNKIMLPKLFWQYDDSDFITKATTQSESLSSEYNQNEINQYIKSKNIKQEGSKYWSNPYLIPNNKLTFQSYKKGSTYNNIYGFVDSYYDNKGIIKPIIRPYYNFKNIDLFLPIDAKGVFAKYNVNPSVFSNPGNVGNPSKVVATVNSSDVPTALTSRFKNATKWLKVKPYDLNFDKKFEAGGGLKNLVSKYQNWYDAATYNLINNIIGVTKTSVSNSAKTFGNLSINYKIINYTDTYGGATVYTDNKLMNLINGYENGYKNQFNFNKGTNLTPTNSTTTDKYSYYKINNDINELIGDKYKQFNGFLSNATMPYWYNSKYEKGNEALDLTTNYSSSENNKLGHYLITIDHGAPYAPFNNVNSYQLANEKQKLINTLTTICLSVAAVLLFFVITSSLLLILLISNLFVSQYERFMILMKTEGYNRKQVMNYTVNVFSPFVLVGWGLGALFSYLSLRIVHNYLYFHLGFAVPFVSTWWVFLVSFILIALMYSSVFILTYRKMSNNTTELLRESSI